MRGPALTPSPVFVSLSHSLTHSLARSLSSFSPLSRLSLDTLAPAPPPPVSPAAGRSQRSCSCFLDPVDPSFQSLSGRLQFMVRRHESNKDSLPFLRRSNAEVDIERALFGVLEQVKGRGSLGPQRFGCQGSCNCRFRVWLSHGQCYMKSRLD